MFAFPIKYQEPIFRPPSEARSLLIPVTIGCSHNVCTYCAMYRSKEYKVRPLEEIIGDIEKARKYYEKRSLEDIRKVFLCDGDALGAPMEILLPVARKIGELFPRLKRIGIYATASNILEKSETELKQLAEEKLTIAYLGTESGSDEVLSMVVKGNTVDDMVESSVKLKNCGWQLSVIIMLGLGGRKFSETHQLGTAKFISTVIPDFFSFLTTVPIPETPYQKLIERGRIEPLTVKELLQEMRGILSNIKCDHGKIIFRANHVSNMFPLAGILPRDCEKLVEIVDRWIAECPENTYPPHDHSVL